jgi:hypothetical protein
MAVPSSRLYPGLDFGDQGREAMYGRIRAKGDWVRRTCPVLLLIAAAGLVLCASATATPLSYTFDTGNQGWMQNQDPASSNFEPAGFAATDGNPGGHLTAKDTGSDSGCPNGNPCQLLTFYSPVVPALGANYGGMASFDLRSRDVDPAFAAELLVFPVGDSYLDGLVPEQIGTTYHHLSIPLVETANWRVCSINGGVCSGPSADQFKALIGAADQIAVIADVGPNGTGENYDLDNVTLTEGASSAPVTPAPPQKKCKKKKKKRAAVAKKSKCKKKHRRAVSPRLRD